MLRNFFQNTLTKIRDWIDKMLTVSDVKKALNIDVLLSEPMTTALDKWTRIYTNNADWLSDYVKSLNLGATIAGEIAGNTTVEMDVEITGSPRADWLAEQFAPVLARMQSNVEYGLAKGGIVFKPYIKGGRIAVDYVQADQFYPISFDANGNMTACVFQDVLKIGNHWYTRLEYHNLTGTLYTVRNAAFRGETRDTLGMEVPLASVEEWRDLLPEATITAVKRPLFGYFRVPLANNIDPTSPLGVSCYARAVDLIKQADTQWSDLLWEFESGRRALYVDELAFDRDTDGKPILPNKRLYRTIKATGAMEKETFYEEWSPNLREANMISGLDTILKRIELTCGLAFGTLVTDPGRVEMTATEIKSSRQRTYLTITNTQKALQSALDGLLYAMDVWTTLEKLAPVGAYQATYSFDDSIVADHDTQFQQDSMSLSQKTMSRVEFRIRNYGETEEIAKQKIAEIDAENQSNMELFTNNPINQGA